jgi:3-hydroxyisobutyrate dehydrogenase-like beta-hydroxyacid dehydrogenase
VCQAIQKAVSQIWHGDVGVVARGREHGEGLDVNIGYVFLASEGMCADGMSEGMDDEVGAAAGLIGLTEHLRADLNRMRHHLSDLLDEVISRIVEATAQAFGIASQRMKGDAMFFDKIFEARWSGENDVMSTGHQAEGERKKRLDITTRTIRENGNIHEQYFTLRKGVDMNIGILHPGEMGISIAASAINNEHQVHWLSVNRSEKTRSRAKKHGLLETRSLATMCKDCEVILSVCPPHAAEEVSVSVMSEGYAGLYLDANAISPARARKIGQIIQGAGGTFVDGGIIGGPAWEPKSTWLYLSGEKAEAIVSIFSSGPLETKVIGNEFGQASALKMCYAAYSKGTTALLSAILAAAESNGVRDELYQQWELDEDGLSEQVNRRTRRVTAKAWRFEGEMLEIAKTFEEAGLPGGFHDAAGEIYHRMAGFKDSHQTPEVDDVLKALLP